MAKTGKAADRPNVALADYTAPARLRRRRLRRRVRGHRGRRPGRGAREVRGQAGDDYYAILLTALADRLAEAFAERLHEKVRRELWGYAPDEALDNAALIAESYQGIRPGARLPGLPRPHREAH